MTRFTTIFTMLALVCVTALGCGEDSTTAPPSGEDPPTTGTVVVDRSPNTLSCSWTLTGPDSYSHNGTGDETIEDLDPGDYTLTWTEMAGWNCPSPQSETKAVTSGGTTTFTGTYVQQEGSITINAEPNAINAPWTLTGPSSYSHSGSGDETLTGLTPGSYTITWGAVSGWDLPDPSTETLALADGGSLTFDGTYTEQVATGTVSVRLFPPDTAGDAPWHLDGPGGFSADGTGDQTFNDMTPGDYTVTWGALANHDPPDPAAETATLAAGETLYLDGHYQPLQGFLRIIARPVDIQYTAPWHLEGPDGFTMDGTGFWSAYVYVGEYTITWDAVEGYITPAPETTTLEYNQSFDFWGYYTEIVE